MIMDSIKDFCINHVNQLDKDSREEVVDFLIKRIDDSLISEGLDGTRINLDIIDQLIIDDLYKMIKSKLET